MYFLFDGASIGSARDGFDLQELADWAEENAYAEWVIRDGFDGDVVSSGGAPVPVQEQPDLQGLIPTAQSRFVPPDPDAPPSIDLAVSMEQLFIREVDQTEVWVPVVCEENAAVSLAD